MDKPRYMLDSNVLINALNHKLDLVTVLDTLPDAELYINMVVEIEVLAKSEMSEQEESSARALLDSFLWADMDKATRDEAIRIRRGNAKSVLLPDDAAPLNSGAINNIPIGKRPEGTYALIAANAISLNATVLSDDPHLRDFKWSGYTARPC